MTHQTPLFFDDICDALRCVVQALGGSKAVGAKLWPEKSPDAAGRLLADCLNPAKAEKLSPDQVLLIARWGHEVGCHAYMTFMAQECGYTLHVVSPEAQRDALADAITSATRTLSQLVRTAEKLQESTR